MRMSNEYGDQFKSKGDDFCTPPDRDKIREVYAKNVRSTGHALNVLGMLVALKKVDFDMVTRLTKEFTSCQQEMLHLTTAGDDESAFRHSIQCIGLWSLMSHLTRVRFMDANFKKEPPQEDYDEKSLVKSLEAMVFVAVDALREGFISDEILKRQYAHALGNGVIDRDILIEALHNPDTCEDAWIDLCDRIGRLYPMMVEFCSNIPRGELPDGMAVVNTDTVVEPAPPPTPSAN